MEPVTYDDLVSENEHLNFIIGFLYDALGPANDDVLDMAEEAWENRDDA